MKQKTLDNEPITRFIWMAILLAFLVAGSNKAHSQPVIGVGIMAGKGIGGELKAGYQIGKVTVAYNQRAYLRADLPAYFGLYLGYDLADNWELGAGGYYRYQSADREKDLETGKRLNYFTPSIGITYKRPIWQTSLSYIDKHIQVGVLFGLNVKLYNND